MPGSSGSIAGQGYRRNTVFSRDNMFRVIDAMTNEIRTAQPRRTAAGPPPHRASITPTRSAS
jgi:hypothetical protein